MADHAGTRVERPLAADRAILVHDRPLRIMFGSNSPLVCGGYGGTTALLVPRLRDRLGVDIAVSATYGHYGRVLTWNGIPIYPPGQELFNNDIHAAHARTFGADVLLTHQDVWTQSGRKITAGNVRWSSWHPVDSEPLAPAILDQLRDYCYLPIALSHFGQEQMKQAGLDTPLVLQGVDTQAYVPGDRASARRALGFPQSAFITGIVARNSGYPSRKAYPQQIAAWIQFAQRHDDAWLYVHAAGDRHVDKEAIPIAWQLRDAGLLDRVLWAQPYDLNGGYSQEQMVLRYQALDCLLSVSMAEGFGLPIVEAQACGIPVIVGDWTAMPENVRAGWMVPRERSEAWPVSPLECFWRLPHVDAIRWLLDCAYDAAGRVDAAALHKAIVAEFDQDLIVDQQWRPVLTLLAKRIEGERIPWHVHAWTGYAFPTADGLVRSCTVRGCSAEEREGEIDMDGFPLDIAGVQLDIADDADGGVRRAIADEIVRTYKLQDLDVPPDAVILDVGAHVGIVSCFLSRRFPLARIFAFEPIVANYARLERNIQANNAQNVRAFPVALTSDGRALTLSGDSSRNTGGWSAYATQTDQQSVKSIAIGAFLDSAEIDQIALLKLDCEGCEYELIESLGERLRDVGTLIMEVHENDATRLRFGSGARLIARCEEVIPVVHATLIRIPEKE